MTKRNLSSILLIFFMLSLFGCDSREREPEWTWEAEMLGEAGATEGYSALAATGESFFS